MPSKRWTSGGTGYNGLFGDSFFSDCWDMVDSPRRKRIISEDITTEVPEEKVKPWFRKTNLGRINDDDIYQVMLEVSNFTPSELNVKLVNDKTVIVEGKHGERPDSDGFVSREFSRKYILPDHVVPSSVECYLSRDGVLVIRGHAPRRSHIPFGNQQEQSHILENENIVPIFTRGYSANTNTITENDHKERIIPISMTHENGQVNKAKTYSNGFSDQKNGPFIQVQEETYSGRSGRNSERDVLSPSPQLKDDREKEKNGWRSRTVSFTDDDTIASNSPIIEEPASTASNGPTPSPEPQPSTSKKIPPLSRQNNVNVESISESRSRSSSRMSEERFERSQTPTIPKDLSKNKGIDSVKFDLDDKFDNIRLGDRNRKSPIIDDFDKIHKEIIERHRHLSRESLNKLQKESDQLLQSVRTRSPRLHHRSNDDIFDSVFKRVDHSPMNWDFEVPPKSSEEQYEKKFEKGYDKDGNWTERLQERTFSQQYSSYKSDNFQPKSMTRDDKQKSLQHHISSAA